MCLCVYNHIADVQVLLIDAAYGAELSEEQLAVSVSSLLCLILFPIALTSPMYYVNRNRRTKTGRTS